MYHTSRGCLNDHVFLLSQPHVNQDRNTSLRHYPSISLYDTTHVPTGLVCRESLSYTIQMLNIPLEPPRVEIQQIPQVVRPPILNVKKSVDRRLWESARQSA